MRWCLMSGLQRCNNARLWSMMPGGRTLPLTLTRRLIADHLPPFPLPGKKMEEKELSFFLLWKRKDPAESISPLTQIEFSRACTHHALLSTTIVSLHRIIDFLLLTSSSTPAFPPFLFGLAALAIQFRFTTKDVVGLWGADKNECGSVSKMT